MTQPHAVYLGRPNAGIGDCLAGGGRNQGLQVECIELAETRMAEADHDGVGCGLMAHAAPPGMTSRLRNVPMPSTSSSTTSPGDRKRMSSRPHPPSTVPEPRNSPG